MVAYAVARMIIGVIDLLVQLIGTEEVDQVVHELLGLRGIKVMEKEDMINIFINMRCQLPFPPDVLQIFNVGVSPGIEHILVSQTPKNLVASQSCRPGRGRGQRIHPGVSRRQTHIIPCPNDYSPCN